MSLERRPLGRTGLLVSRLSFGASAVGGTFGDVSDEAAIRTVRLALDAGISLVDTSPFYGLTKSESVVGRALQGVPREDYVLATKAGRRGWSDFDFTHEGIRSSVLGSLDRLGVDYLDIVHLHDIEYQGGRHLDVALGEGLDALEELRAEGRIRFLGVATYPIDVVRRAIRTRRLDTALVHNHYTLSDTRLLTILPEADERGVGVISASPFGSGLLTHRGAADWHPATQADRAAIAVAVDLCRDAGTSLEELALQFALANQAITTTLVSTANPANLKRNLEWAGRAPDPDLVAAVRHALGSVLDREWVFDSSTVTAAGEGAR